MNNPSHAVALLVLPAFMALAACGGSAADDRTAAPAPVEAIVVGGDSAGGSVTAQRDFPAILRRDREANLSFRVGGTLTAVAVRPGMRVAAGSTIAAIDSTAYTAILASRSAEAARLARAADRYARLVPEGAVAEAQALDARDALAAARAAQAIARYDAQSARLVAPFPGVILTRRAEVGETVAPGQPVASIADLRSSMLAVADLPASDAAQLQVGMAAKIIVQGLPPLSATVLRIAAASDSRSGTVPVDLRLAGTPPALASGTTATARFETRTPAQSSTAPVFNIPAGALLEAQRDQGFVFVIDSGGRARRKAVRFLGFADQDARIAGLARGTRVITIGAGFVTEGQLVSVSRP
jgi:RND family efflux transporter MFP subunit